MPEGRLNLKLSRYLDDPRPIDPTCDCYACTHYSRAYLAHLVRAEEMLAPRMISLHNLRYLHRLMESARTAIQAGNYGDFAQDFAGQRFGHQIPAWFIRALQEGGHWN